MENKVTDVAQLPEAKRTKCEIFTRVMGYFRPKSCANIGKQGEFAQRKYFDEQVALNRDVNDIKKAA